MDDIVKNIGIVCLGISGVIAALYAIRKFWRSVKPIKISPSINLTFGESQCDSISAVITNRSEETLYIVKCHARESKPLKYSILTHLKHPLIKPSLYPCVWWGAKIYELLNQKQYKLEAGETLELNHVLNFNHPIAGFMEYEFKVIVQLSTGRKVVSERFKVPLKWHFSSLRNNA